MTESIIVWFQVMILFNTLGQNINNILDRRTMFKFVTHVLFWRGRLKKKYWSIIISCCSPDCRRGRITWMFKISNEFSHPWMLSRLVFEWLYIYLWFWHAGFPIKSISIFQASKETAMSFDLDHGFVTLQFSICRLLHFDRTFFLTRSSSDPPLLALKI